MHPSALPSNPKERIAQHNATKELLMHVLAQKQKPAPPTPKTSAA
jgi:hypothetical protein